jgi:hypothetical protein
VSLFLPMIEARRLYADLMADAEYQMFDLDADFNQRRQELEVDYLQRRTGLQRELARKLDAHGFAGRWWLR